MFQSWSDLWRKFPFCTSVFCFFFLKEDGETSLTKLTLTLSWLMQEFLGSLDPSWNSWALWIPLAIPALPVPGCWAGWLILGVLFSVPAQ